MLLEELTNWEMLSQVWFVHDYVQLQFHDDHTINVYNPSVVKVGDSTYGQGDFGYADSLVSIIGSKIATVEYFERERFTLIFDSGSTFSIDLKDDAANIPEAFEISISAENYIEFNH